MGFFGQVSVLVITHNEAANIGRTLDAIRLARKILIVDSGSTDETLEIVRRHPNTQIVERAFDSFAEQCNFGLARLPPGWVLSLDADYELSADLVAEIDKLAPSEAICGYSASFVYRIHGKALRSTLYPPRTVLYRRERASYRNEGHGHRVVIDGTVGKLAAPIYHDDRKPLSRWLSSQQGYAKREATHLLAAPPGTLRRKDRIRLMAWPAPILVFFYTLLIKRCLFDGWAGWLYVLQRTLAELLIAIEIVDRRLLGRRS